MPIMRCWKCAGEIDADQRIEFRARCPGCDAALHSCLNCGHYQPGHYNDCRETQAERVVDKQRANFCEYFRPRTPAPQAAATDARRQLDALFKKPR
jgi:hypothetical protein